MKIVAMADMHGTLPEVPACDLLLLGGDLCPVENHKPYFQAEWLDTTFRNWLERVKARKIIGVAGNHDRIFQDAPELVPGHLPWTYLQDSGTEWEGWKIWGTPWQPWFHDWAFNLYEEALKAKWAPIPEDTNILVLHGPPWAYGDGVPASFGHVQHSGSHSLLARIDVVKPRLAIFGHIHEGRGVWQRGPTTLANVTIMDGGYNPVYPPWEYELG